MSRRGHLIFILILIGFGMVSFLLLRQTNQSVSRIFSGNFSSTIPSRLNGRPVTKEANTRRPIAVVIENHPEARPQSGLSSATTVYEAIAEGGITRFLAIYGPELPEKVGPVRSARQFYVEWANDWDALFAHVGGSKQARELIRSIGLDDMDQFAIGDRAYRREPAEGKAIEHTMYLDLEKLYRAATTVKNVVITGGNVTPWPYKRAATLENRGSGQTITVDFSTSSYTVVWKYDREQNAYVRHQDGAVHRDALTGKPITAQTLLFMTINRSLLVEEGLPSVYTFSLIGSGKATVYLDGREISGTWKRKRSGERVNVIDLDGRSIAINPGLTWVTAVNPDTVKVSTTP